MRLDHEMPRQIATRLVGAQRVRSAQGAVRRTRKYAVLTALLAGTVAVSAACWFNSEDIEFSIDNRTDAVVCYYPSHEDALAATCLQEAKPRSTTLWVPGCGDGPGADTIPVTVVLTVKEGGRQIYQRTEECRIWQESDRTFVIEQEGDEFVVTDPLTGATPSP